MCGRCQFAAERCAEIRQIIDLIQWKYGAEQWLSDSSQTEGDPEHGFPGTGSPIR